MRLPDRPNMEGRSYFKFSHYKELIALGEQAAREQLPAILDSLTRAGALPEADAPAAVSLAWPERKSIHTAN